MKQTLSPVNHNLFLATFSQGICEEIGDVTDCDWFPISEQPLIPILSEEYLVEILEEHFIEKGMPIAREIPLKSKRIDLVAYDGKELIAIEVKLSDWKRAFQQALTYRFGAEKVYIAMPEEYIHRVDTELLERYGIGLMSIGDGIRILIDAKKQNYVDKEIREKIIKEVEHA